MSIGEGARLVMIVARDGDGERKTGKACLSLDLPSLMPRTHAHLAARHIESCCHLLSIFNGALVEPLHVVMMVGVNGLEISTVCGVLQPFPLLPCDEGWWSSFWLSAKHLSSETIFVEHTNSIS